MSDNNSNSTTAKRPYATLDLKATEIKVTSIGEKAPFVTPPQTASQTLNMTIKASDVPMPAPASTYATATLWGTGAASAPAAARTSATMTGAGMAAAATVSNASTSESTTKKASVSAAAATTAERPKVTATISAPNQTHETEAARQTVVVKKRGGFFSHLAASIIGGAVALGAWGYGLPELNNRGLIPALPGLGFDSGSSDLALRLAKLEKQQGGDAAVKLQSTEARLAALEKSADTIAQIKDLQSRLVAETKAALAASASDAGMPEQLERIAAVETKLKALTEAGAGDPNAGRLEQLAALTGKVADLETSLATQLTALRKSVAGDVDARLVAATEAAEAAKSGTQRIDRELAGLKSEAVKTGERLVTVKADADRAKDEIKRSQDEVTALKSALEGVKSSTAKPADVASAVSPVSAKIATLEQDLKALAAAEDARRANAERVVLALELQNLKRALDRGQKYEAELAEVEKVAAGKLDLTAFAKFKDQGVPTVADLTKDFRGAANAVIDAETAPASGNVVDRLIAGAKSVIRVRKTDHDAADKSAEAVVARMESALKDGRLGDVIREADGLPAKSKEAASPFLEKVTARASVEQALASLESKLKTTMSGAPAEGPSKTE